MGINQYPPLPSLISEGVKPVDTSNNIRRAAFTLAEVLITLGIIGVVAAMTMPVLINNYQKHALKNQFKVAYSLLNQALLSAIEKNGGAFNCWYWKTIPYPGAVCKKWDGSACAEYSMPDGSPLPADYNGKFDECANMYNALHSELKVVSECKNNSTNHCVPEYKGKDVVNADPDKTMTEILGACPNLATSNLNRFSYKILSNGIITGYERSGWVFIVDVNGSRGPNKWGYDVFLFAPQLHGSNSSGMIIFGGMKGNGCNLKEPGGYYTHEMLENY